MKEDLHIESNHTPNECTLAAIEASERDEEMYGPFDSVEAMMEALESETN